MVYTSKGRWLAATALCLSFAMPGFAGAEEAEESEVISVVATRNPIEAFDYPGALTVVDRAAIEDLATSSVSDLFFSVPNVNFGSGPRRTGNVPSVRGFEGEGVLVLFDGIRQDFLSGHDGRFFIDPDLLRSVEVIRGSGSAVYGSSALGGVIAFQTLNASDVLDDNETLALSVKGGYQGVAEEVSVGGTAFARSADGHLDGVVSLTYRDSGDIALGNGLDLQADDEVYSSLVKGTAVLTDDLTASLTWIGFRNNAIEPNNGQGANTGDLVDKDISSDTIRAGLSYAPEGNRWVNANLTAYGAFTQVGEDELDSNRSISRDVESFGVIADNRSSFTWGDAVSALVTYGAEFYRTEQVGVDNTTQDGTRGGVPDATADTLGLFVQAEITAATDIGIFSMIPALRYDRFENSAENVGIETEEDAFSPKLGVSYEPVDGLLVFASYSQAFRAPSFNEIFADNIHFTIPLGPFVQAPNFFIPNADLESEESQTWEAGAGYTQEGLFVDGDSFQIKGSWFHSDVTNLIDLGVNFVFSPSCFSPFIPGPCTSGTSQNVNTRNALLDGIEIEASYDAPWAYLNVAYASIDGEDRDTGGYVGILTPNRVNLDAGIKLSDWAMRLGVRSEIAAEFDKTDDPAAIRDSYSVHDIYLVWQPDQGALEGLRVDLGIDNVADEDYERVFAGVPEPGRNYKAIIRWEGTF